MNGCGVLWYSMMYVLCLIAEMLYEADWQTSTRLYCFWKLRFVVAIESAVHCMCVKEKAFLPAITLLLE